MLPHEARIVGMMANPETMAKMLVRLEEENAALQREVARLRKVIDDLPSWGFGWVDKVMWENELRRRRGDMKLLERQLRDYGASFSMMADQSELEKSIIWACEEITALRGEVARYREAVEWAIAHLDGFIGLQDWENFRPLSFKAELKRRAGEGAT